MGASSVEEDWVVGGGKVWELDGDENGMKPQYIRHEGEHIEHTRRMGSMRSMIHV